MPRHLSRLCSGSRLLAHKPRIVFSLFEASCYSLCTGTAFQAEEAGSDDKSLDRG